MKVVFLIVKEHIVHDNIKTITLRETCLVASVAHVYMSLVL